MESDPRARRPIRASALRALIVLSATLGGGAGQAAEPAPLPLSLTDPRTGQAVRLDAGAPVLHIVFFATWCPPCRAELPSLTELDTRWGDGGYRLVLVAVSSRHSEERLRDFLRTSGTEAEMLFDSAGAAERAFRAEQLPSHVLLDARGKILIRAPNLTDEIQSTIDKIMIDQTRRPGRR